MVKDSTFLTIAQVLLIVALGLSCYILGKYNCKPDEIVIHRYIYDVPENQSGILEISIGPDSLANVIFIEKGDTFALDNLHKEEFNALTSKLYENN